MRHGNKINKLGRNTAHRKALLRNLASSLFIHGYIRTTLAKAKALRPFAERIICKATKVNSVKVTGQRLHLIRNISTDIQDKKAYDSLIRVWGVLCLERPGGYTRIIKLGTRQGDRAEMAYIGIVLDERYLTTHNLSNVALKSAFSHIADKLLQVPLPAQKILRSWTHIKMPEIICTSRFSRNGSSIIFEIVFNPIADLKNTNWPVYNGRYSDLPLTIEVDCSDMTSVSYSFDSSEMNLTPPCYNVSNIIKVMFSPTAERQRCKGEINIYQIKAKQSRVSFCEVIIYGPVGRIFSQNLLSQKTINTSNK